MELTIIIPCHNEERTLSSLLDAVIAAPAPIPKQVLVVDDGSTDGTARILEAYARQGRIAVIRHPQNRGKGAAVRTGIGAAEGDIVLIQDADLEYDPHQYPALLAPILAGKAEVVFGSRFLSLGARRVPAFWHMFVNRALTFLSNALTGLGLTDMETCHKVFRREIVQGLALREERFGIEPELTARIAGIPGIRIFEVAIPYEPRTRAEGKKIGLRDGLRALWCILRCNTLDRLVRRNRWTRERLEGLRARWEERRVLAEITEEVHLVR
ncbi:MAG: glycosyltransferase family 2 protein [Planctomycetes bacterium]|nr:glycosyltransferase family 2 protein [Planctomycetota bacterium]